MSTPHEASLTEKERAILAGLAAQAEADDPSLAATLRGRQRRATRIASVRRSVHLTVPDAVSHWGWGVALAVLGLVLMVASLSVSLVLGVVGALLACAGVYRAAVAHQARTRHDDAHESTPATTDN
jgi:hypothetical protein